MQSLENEVPALLICPPLPWVSSDTLAYYLLNANYSPWGKFSSYLNLDIYKPAFVQLYRQSEESLVSPHLVEKTKCSLSLLTEFDNPEIKRYAKVISEQINLKAPGERSSVIHYDPEERMIKYSDLTFGDFTSTKLSTVELIRNGKRPMMEVHTHPEDKLFSSADYFRLLLKFYENGDGLVKGIVVLCPNFQFLALATAQTPRLDLESVIASITNWGEDFNLQQDNKKYLQNRTKSLIDRLSIYHLTHFKSFLETASELGRKESAGELAKEEVTEQMQKLLRRAEESQNRYSLKFDRVFKKAVNAYVGYIKHLENEMIIGYNRWARVKLYWATDMIHFQEFSA